MTTKHSAEVHILLKERFSECIGLCPHKHNVTYFCTAVKILADLNQHVL